MLVTFIFVRLYLSSMEHHNITAMLKMYINYMFPEVCASCSVEVETEAEAGGTRSGSSGSPSWCEGEGEAGDERGYGSGDSLAEDAALLGAAQGAHPPRLLRTQRRDVAVDLHLLRPDV